MEVVIREGLQNGSWVTNPQETKPFSKKNALVLKKYFLRSKARKRVKKQKKRRHRGEQKKYFLRSKARTRVTTSAVSLHAPLSLAALSLSPLARSLPCALSHGGSNCVRTKAVTNQIHDNTLLRILVDQNRIIDMTKWVRHLVSIGCCDCVPCSSSLPVLLEQWWP